MPVYVEPNERFRLPADGSRDVIMIGPGTGVAPFRGFVQERAASGARGPQLAVLRRASFPHAISSTRSNGSGRSSRAR